MAAKRLGRLGKTLNGAWRGFFAPAEDPRHVTPLAFERQLRLLAHVREAQTELAQARQRLEATLRRQRGRLPRLEAEAQRAVAAGEDDVARQALRRRELVALELEGLRRRLDGFARDEQGLILAEQQLSARLEAFRAQREIVVARSEAQTRIAEALREVARDVNELGIALDQAQERLDGLESDAPPLKRLSGLIEATGGAELDDRGDLRAIAEAVEQHLQELRENVRDDARAARARSRPGRLPDVGHR